MKLYLVQHGEAKPREEDPERGLTPRGSWDAGTTADFLKPLRLEVHSIWHGEKARVEETAGIFADAVKSIEGVMRREGLEPDSPISPVLRDIERSGMDVMIVGHLPFLSKLASMMAAGREDAGAVKFHMGGIVCLDREEHGWTVDWAVNPGILRSRR